MRKTSRRALSPPSLSGSLSEKVDRVLELRDELVYFLLRVVHVQRSPRAGVDAEVVVQRLRAVVARPHRDAVLVQDHRDVRGVEPFHVEGRQRGPRCLLGARAINFDPLDVLLQLLVHVRPHLQLEFLEPVHPDVAQVVASGPQANRFADGRGTGLELPRRPGKSAVGLKDVLDHLPPSHERRHRLEDLHLSPQEAYPGGSAHLVARAHGEVHLELAEVHRHVGHRLAGVQEHLAPRVAPAPRQGHDVADRVDAPQDVAHVPHGDELGSRPDGLPQALQVQGLRRLVEADVLESELLPPAQDLPGNDVAVVLRDRQHDLVSLPQVLLPPSVSHEVDGLARVPGEHDLPRRLGADEPGHLVPGLFIPLRRLGAQRVDAPVNVRVVVRVVVLHCAKNPPRLLGRRRVVQVHQPLVPVHLPLQDGELPPDARHVLGRQSGARALRRRSRGDRRGAPEPSPRTPPTASRALHHRRRRRRRHTLQPKTFQASVDARCLLL
mmetsp:Transcript_2406/g.6645  ORF Transcript_2406/g.6645 Transcript_2406/m.6645 type:complete len:495 (+) Transcript_2406:517-2001(+)